MSITAQEVEKAIEDIGIKASGNDMMTAHHLKNPKIRKIIVYKLTVAINKWLKIGKTP